MNASVRPGGLARPASHALLRRAQPPGAVRPALLRVARPGVRSTAVDATQPGSGGGGGRSMQKPAGTGGGGGDDDDGARAPSSLSWATLWGPAAVVMPVVAAMFAGLSWFDKCTRSLVRTGDLDKLEASIEKRPDQREASIDKRFDFIDKRFDKLEARMEVMTSRLDALLAVLGAGLLGAGLLGAGLLATWLGRKPGAGRGAE